MYLLNMSEAWKKTFGREGILSSRRLGNRPRGGLKIHCVLLLNLTSLSCSVGWTSKYEDGMIKV